MTEVCAQPCCRAIPAAVLWWGLPSSACKWSRSCCSGCVLHVVWSAQAGRLPLGGNWSPAGSSESHSLDTTFFFLTCACTTLISKGWNKLKLDQVCLHSFCIHVYSMIQLDQTCHCFVRHHGTFSYSCLKIMASKHGWKDKEQARGGRHGFAHSWMMLGGTVGEVHGVKEGRWRTQVWVWVAAGLSKATGRLPSFSSHYQLCRWGGLGEPHQLWDFSFWAH